MYNTFNQIMSRLMREEGGEERGGAQEVSSIWSFPPALLRGESAGVAHHDKFGNSHM